MSRDRVLYTRAAKVRLDMLPAEVRMHVETHLANLVLLMETAPEQFPGLMERAEDCFVATVQGARVLLSVDTSGRTLLVHRVDC